MSDFVDPALSSSRDRFHDGASAASRPVDFILAGDAVQIRDAAGATLATWPLADMRAIDENEVNGTMTFACTDGEGARLLLYPSERRERLLKAKPALRRWRRHRGLRELRTVAIWSAAMMAIVIAGYIGWRPLAGSIAAAVPPAWEARLGDTIRATLVDSIGGCESAAGIAALDALVARIAPASLDGPPITIDVVRQGQPNALALPGNHILVFEGLIADAEAPEMLAGVLAHEIAHLDLDHPTRRIVEQLGLGAIVTIAFGGSDIGNAGLLLAMLSYSRESEAEADDRAIELLEEAGIRTDGLARFFQKIDATQSLDLPDWLSTHPDLAGRAAANPGSTLGDGGADAAAWRAIRAVCARKSNS